MGVGVTLLAMSLLGAAILLLGFVPWLYGQFYPVLGSGMQQLPVLTFFAETHGMVFVVGLISLALARRRALPHPSPGPGPHHRRHRRAQPLPHHRLCDLARMRRLVRRSVGATARGKYGPMRPIQ